MLHRLLVLIAAVVAYVPNPAAAAHPLDPLSEAELSAAVDVLKTSGKLTERMLFPILVLNEPAKDEVLSWKPGRTVRREAFAMLLDRAAAKTYEAVVDLTKRQVISWREVPGVQPAVLIEEFSSPAKLVRDDPRFQAAMQKRGITDLENVQIDTWAAGLLTPEQRALGLRVVRALIYYRGKGGTNPYFRPVEGVSALIDVSNKRVLAIEDTGVVPVVKAAGDLDVASLGKQRGDIKPLRITQADGASFHLDGQEVRWQKWRFRFGVHPREGLVLYTVGYEDKGVPRSILYRASLSEMVVPYGDVDGNWTWRNAFDLGEYGVGRLANTLRVGLDTPDNATLIDATFADDFGKAYVQPRVVAVYERDGGILWKHFDFDTGHDETRRARELVVMTVATIGNYDYALAWVFHQDGALEFEASLTGIMLPKGVKAKVSTGKGGEGDERFGRLVHEYVVAPNHQHFFNFRLDFDVDGVKNRLIELNDHAVPAGVDNPMMNAFMWEETRRKSETDAQSDMNMHSNRAWRVVSQAATNSLGQPTGYLLVPGHSAMPYVQPDSAVRKRAGFLNHHLWATRYKPDEMNGAGRYVNLSLGGDGLAAWTADNESIDNQDLVLWYTFGVTHNPRPEEWPVMPVHKAGFMLMPDGFFDRNPALDVPPPPTLP